jgi:Protein of unknown function (DUF3617)
MLFRFKFVSSLAALACMTHVCLAGEPANAEPPVRPGLWEVVASGPSISERIKNTPVEKRQTMEQVAGITIRGDAIVRRVCITPEMLAQSISIKTRPDCTFKQEWKGKVTKISYVCPNGSGGQGELTYPNKESYKGWMDSERAEKPGADAGSNTPSGGQNNSQNNSQNSAQKSKKTIRVIQTGKWMAKDCAAKNN